MRSVLACGGGVLALWVLASAPAPAQSAWHAPSLPGGQSFVTDTSPEFLKPIGALAPGVTIAATPPTVDFLYYT